MSFLGYIGKSLGAGSAPIARGIETATYEQSADEYRRDRANREEARRMEMAGLRRKEQAAIDAEAERQRIMREGQGRVTAGYTPPGGVIGTGAALPEGAGERIELPRAPSRPAAGLSAPTTSAVAAGVTEALTESEPETPRAGLFGRIPGFGQESPVASRQQTDPVLISSRLAEIEKALAADAARGRTRDPERLENRRLLTTERDNLRGSLENIIGQQPEIVALNEELAKLGTSRGTTNRRKEIIAERDALAKRLSRLSAAELQQRRGGATPATTPLAAAAPPAGLAVTPAVAAPAAPTAAAAPPAATAAAAQPTPAQPAPVSYPQSVAEIDPERDFEIYQIEPGRLSYDMTVVASEYDRYVQRIQDAYRFTDMSDPKNVQATFLAVQPLEDALIALDGQYAKLEVSQGIGMAMGGDTRYINSVMTAALGYPLEVEPRLNTDGSIGYGININNVPMGDGELFTPEQMRTSLMRMVDTQLDLQLTQQELTRSAEMAKMYAEAQIEGKLLEMKISGDLYQEIYSQMLQGEREQAKILLEKANQTPEQMAIMADGTIIYTDKTGALRSLTTEETKIGGRKQRFPVTQTVTSRP